MTTLSRERRKKIFDFLEEHYQDNPKSIHASKYNLKNAKQLVEIVKSRSEIQAEYKVTGIESAIFGDRPVTEEDMTAKIEHNALVAFEASFGVNTEKGQMLAWYGRKPEWNKLRKDVVELYKADPKCFEKYKVWRLTPYVKGAVSLKDVQRDPKCFMASWVAFVEATSYGNLETNNTYTDEKGLPLT